MFFERDKYTNVFKENNLYIKKMIIYILKEINRKNKFKENK